MELQGGDWATLGKSVVFFIIGLVNSWKILVVIDSSSSVSKGDQLTLLLWCFVCKSFLDLLVRVTAFLIIVI